MDSELLPFVRRGIILILFTKETLIILGCFSHIRIEKCWLYFVFLSGFDSFETSPSLSYVDRPQDSGAQCLSSGLDWKKSLLVWRWEKNIRSVQGQWPISYNPDQFRPQKSLWSRSGPAGRVSVAPLLAHPFNSHHRAMWRICYDREGDQKWGLIVS